MSGKVGDLSERQAATLDQLKDNVRDVRQAKHDDAYLLRWLRARNFDLSKSEKMLRDHLEWRKRNGVDHITSTWEPPEVLLHYYPGGLLGFDKEDHPVMIDLLGFIDIKGLMFSARKSDIGWFKVYCQERLNKLLEDQSTKYNRRIDTVSLVFDMDGIGLRHLCKPVLDLFCEISRIFEANYPEMLKFVYIINVPRIFPIAYNVVKPFVSEETKEKICILGSGWKEKLLEVMHPDQLPVRWGGTKPDPVGLRTCWSTVSMGGEIPHSYYMEKPAGLDMSNFTVSTVHRASSVQLDYDITVHGCVLRWHFWTEGKDIGFGVFRRTADERQKAGEMEDVVTSSRVNSHLIPELGSICCDTLGTYVVRFDNTYSWLNAKRVLHHIEVLQPDSSHLLLSNGPASPTDGAGTASPS